MPRLVWFTLALGATLAASFAAQTAPTTRTSETNRAARISEDVRTIKTYPYSEPNPVPILARDARLYPYHSFEGYAHEGVPRQWKVVHLENDLIEVFVLPEIGGKIWGARVKKTGHEFIYRNEVVKFRNIALRGPWTSGGIEFNFGVIGHAPSTASPVDYTLKQNPDGSVSCVVGAMDLPSRTEWRVEIRLPADKASFQTNVLWHNPTSLEQPYYNWMTAAAFARNDLELSIPGTGYLQHSGARESWPVDDRGRSLPVYRNHTFGGNKSFHVVGELQDFFGGYYRDAGYGFGHWARHEEMPGQKLWLWALSRSGGIWEDLLTDTDGQYVEFQAGRLLVQYQPGSDINPITQAGFDPSATDRWTESWFPVEGLGGLTDASADGAMFVREANGQLEIAAHAFGAASDTLRVWSGGQLVQEQPITLAPLVPVTVRVVHVGGTPYRVELRALGLDYTSDSTSRALSRPFEADPAARASIPETERLVFEGRELARARRYGAARPLFESALAKQPWHRDALVAMADLEYRRARYEEGLAHATRALRLDTYDPEANFAAGNLYRALGRAADARDAFGWAARSMTYRSAANVQLAEIALARSDLAEAERYAHIAVDYNRLNLSAWDLLAIVGRVTGNRALAVAATSHLLDLDPLHHLVRAEAFLAAPTPEALNELVAGLRSEYPDQTILELAIAYANRGRKGDAIALLDGAARRMRNPLLGAWRAYLAQDRAALARSADVAFVFPYRRETLPVLDWAAAQTGHWTWTYLRALNLWALDRPQQAEALLRPLASVPDVAAFYATRASLVELAGGDPEADLQQADRLAGADRNIRIPLIRYYQQRSRWTDALAASGRARERFPTDFNLDLLHVRSLVNLARAAEAIAILDKTRVLPSENARESHQLYVQAHALAAFAAIDAGRLDDAHAQLEAALEWPEHLGQGRPYDPDERLIRFLVGWVEERRGRTGRVPSRATLPPADPRRPDDLDQKLLRRALSLPEAPRLHRAPAIPNVIDGVVFEPGNWTPHLQAGSKGLSWGNHRAVIEIHGPASNLSAPDAAVVVTIPWRRRDPDPAAKAIVVVDARTNEPIADAWAARVDRASGDVVFRPNAGSTTYYVYYMPWQTGGGPYPAVSYPASVLQPTAAWAASVRARPIEGQPRGRTTRIQSVNAFHSFFPMEIVATDAERARFMASAANGWRLVPEHRDYPIRMRRFLPKHWTDGPRPSPFESRVLRDEYFTFQVAVVSGERPLDDVRVTFEGFPESWRRTLTCFNRGGVDETGRTFTKPIAVAAGTVQPLWIGVLVPRDQPAGAVEGNVVVSVAGRDGQVVRVRLDVDDGVAVNHGFDEPEMMTRLVWLNSVAGTDPDFIIQPFVPVEIGEANGRELSVLGRTIVLGASGLPDRILSYFTPEVTLGTRPEPVLARPLSLDIVVGGATEPLRASGFTVRREAKGRASWSAESRSDRVRMTVVGALEYDGMLDYRIAVQALTDITVDDIALPVSLVPEAAEYMLGLGRKGGRRPERIEWTWKVENHQEGVWLGGINRGLQYVLRDDNYERPLNTNFYQSKPLNLPPSWYNGGRGGIRIETTPDAVTATNYSGPRRLPAGATLHFNVRFLLTPFKPIDTRTHFNTRFVHKYVPVDEVKAASGTVVNIHHANEINPYINYPFFNLDTQTAYIEEAHAKGIKVKLYNTIRELTYRAHELFALRSLGDEILNDGKGGGHSWLQEHLEDRYYSAWHAASVDDAAVLDKGTSRWTNYYVEGLAWLAEHQRIDGLYLDDIAFSRETVKRMVSVLHASREQVIIDLHSASQFNPRDGFINSAMLYMEHFPYMSRLWFGEYFDYSQAEDYWMTEVSGLPFGLMGEMLQDGGHPYRGLLFGMTSRLYGTTDPRPVWALMNDFGIADSRMRGYWLRDTPVRTGNPRVLATTYVRPDESLITLASWSDRDETVSLDLDLAAMGLPASVRVHAPAVAGLQPLAEIDPGAVVVPARQGLFLRVARRR